MIKNLNEYKNAKIALENEKDLTGIINNLTNSIESLKVYSKHINIMECLSILHTSRTLFEIQLNKVKKK